MKGLGVPNAPGTVGHSDEVAGLKLSSDGRLLASIAKNEVKVWDTATGERLMTLPYERAIGTVVFWPKEDKFVVGSSDGAVKVWEPGKNEALHEFKRDEKGQGGITALGFPEGGKMMAWGFAGGMVKLWKCGKKTPVETLDGHSDRVTRIVFSRGGKIVASASRDHSVMLWNIRDETLQTIEDYSGSLGGIAISPDCKLFAYTSGTDSKTVNLFDIDEGKVKRFGPSKLGSIADVAFLPGGESLAAIHGGKAICLWHTSTGTLLHTFKLERKITTLSSAGIKGARIETDCGKVDVSRSRSDPKPEESSPATFIGPFVDKKGVQLGDECVDPAKDYKKWIVRGGVVALALKSGGLSIINCGEEQPKSKGKSKAEQATTSKVVPNGRNSKVEPPKAGNNVATTNSKAKRKGNSRAAAKEKNSNAVPKPTSKAKPDFSLKGKTILVTGKILNCDRGKHVLPLLESHGAIIAKSLNNSVEVVVLGNEPGPKKMQKVEERKIETRKWDVLAEELGLS